MRSGSPALPAPDEGTVAGRYELGPVIGVGRCPVVRRGRDLHGGAPVAIKLFHPGASPHDHRQLQQELAALALLEHPRAGRAARRRHRGGSSVRGHRTGRGPDGGRPHPGRADAGRRGAHARRAARRRARARARRRLRAPGHQAGQRHPGAREPATTGRFRHQSCGGEHGRHHRGLRRGHGCLPGPGAGARRVGRSARRRVRARSAVAGGADRAAGVPRRCGRVGHRAAVPPTGGAARAAHRPERAAGRDDLGRPDRAPDGRRGGHRAGSPPGGRAGRRGRWPAAGALAPAPAPGGAPIAEPPTPGLGRAPGGGGSASRGWPCWCSCCWLPWSA